MKNRMKIIAIFTTIILIGCEEENLNKSSTTNNNNDTEMFYALPPNIDPGSL